MSLADDAKLLLIPTGYKASKVYSVFPTDGDGDFTYTRSGDASRVNPGGLIETVGTNIPRIDHFGGGCPTLNLEPQRTNLFQRSEEFDSTYWTKARASVTANQIISPDGQLTADKFFDSTDNNSHLVYKSMSISNGVEYSFSCFMKKGTLSKGFLAFNSADAQTVVFDLENGIVESQGANIDNSKIENYGNDWYKCSFTHTSTSTTFLYRVGTYNGGIYYTGTGNDYIYIWGAQLEQGDYVSSYIKTTTGIVTRQKDECLNGGDANLFNITEGTFFVDANNFGTPLNSYNMITISDGTGSNYIRFIYESSRIRVSVLGLGDYFITSVNDNQRNKTLVTFKENEMKVFFNGSLVHTDTLGVLPTNMDRLNFASQSGTSRHFEGKVYDTRVYDRVLTEAEAIELTTL